MINDTVAQIKKNIGIPDPFENIARKTKMMQEIPKSRRCETCLSYSEATFPGKFELCRACILKLVGRTEKQYIPQMSAKIFLCDFCGKRNIWKTVINPIMCLRCLQSAARRIKDVGSNKPVDVPGMRNMDEREERSIFKVVHK